MRPPRNCGVPACAAVSNRFRILGHTLTFILAALLGLPAAMSQNVATNANQTAAKFSKRISVTVKSDYLLFLPRGYGAKPSRKWPLILFLHGSGERGGDVSLVAKHGPPKVVLNKPDFPFIVVSPQCPEDQVWSNDVLMALLDDICAKYKVDKTRIYLTGLSMGGYGAWSLGLEHPERFAAIAPICGGGDPLRLLLATPAQTKALRTLGVWAFHGAKDNVVPPVESERMIKSLKDAGCKDLQLTIYPDAGHDSWTESYANPRLYDWFLSHQRGGRQAAR